MRGLEYSEIGSDNHLDKWIFWFPLRLVFMSFYCLKNKNKSKFFVAVNLYFILVILLKVNRKKKILKIQKIYFLSAWIVKRPNFSTFQVSRSRL